jgi:hypothetical protein
MDDFSGFDRLPIVTTFRVRQIEDPDTIIFHAGLWPLGDETDCNIAETMLSPLHATGGPSQPFNAFKIGWTHAPQKPPGLRRNFRRKPKNFLAFDNWTRSFPVQDRVRDR